MEGGRETSEVSQIQMMHIPMPGPKSTLLFLCFLKCIILISIPWISIPQKVEDDKSGNRLPVFKTDL